MRIIFRLPAIPSMQANRRGLRVIGGNGQCKDRPINQVAEVVNRPVQILRQAFMKVLVATLPIKLMLSISRNHANADQLAVDKIGKLGVDKNKHVSTWLVQNLDQVTFVLEIFTLDTLNLINPIDLFRHPQIGDVIA